MSEVYVLRPTTAKRVAEKINEVLRVGVSRERGAIPRAMQFVEISGSPQAADAVLYDAQDDDWFTAGKDHGFTIVGGSVETGRTYLSMRSGVDSKGVQQFVVLGDADEQLADPLPVYFGGLVNTTKQVIKGPKQFRNSSTWRNPHDADAFLINNSVTYSGKVSQYGLAETIYAGVGTGYDSGEDDWVEFTSTLRSIAGSSGVGGPPNVTHGYSFEVTGWNDGVARGRLSGVSLLDTVRSPYSQMRLEALADSKVGTAGIYAYPSGGVLSVGSGAAGGSAYSLPGFPGLYSQMYVSDEYPFNVKRGSEIKVGIDLMYDPAVHGLVIVGGIVVGYWLLTEDPPTSPPAAGTPYTPEEPEPVGNSFACINGNCVEVEDGPYATYYDCITACGTNPPDPDEPPPNTTLTWDCACVEDAPYDGSAYRGVAVPNYEGTGKYDDNLTANQGCFDWGLTACAPAWYQVCPEGKVGAAVCEQLTAEDAAERGIVSGPHADKSTCEGAFPAFCSEAAFRYDDVTVTAAAPAEKIPLPCVHLGESTGERVTCRTCVNKTTEVFGCQVHGECTVDRSAYPRKLRRDGNFAFQEIAWCGSCPDRQPRPG